MTNPNPKTGHLKKYQFKEGEPRPIGAGRKTGSRNLSTILKELLEAELVTKDPLTGDKVTAHISDLINAQLVRKALDGDNKAIREIYDRLEGRPKQKLDVTGDMKVKGFLNLCMEKAVKRTNT